MHARILSFRVLFSGLVALGFGYGIYGAVSYAYLAMIFPLYLSIGMFVLACINFVMEIRISSESRQHAGGGFTDLEAEWDVSPKEVLRRFFFFLGIILVLYGSIVLIGYLLSITLFIILCYRFISKTTWLKAIVAGMAGLGFIFLISELLVIEWPSGIINRWISIP
jgi:hypothetical protein